MSALRDRHNAVSPAQAREEGCTCKFGCRSCGMAEAMMGACRSWMPCALGRAETPGCPLIGAPEDRPVVATSRAGRGSA